MEISNLNKLSAELRNAIYELVLVQDKPLVVCRKHLTPELTAVQPALTRVCRQIREETLGMFYHGNTFVMEVISVFDTIPYNCMTNERIEEVAAWLRCMHQEHLDSIKEPGLVISTLEMVYFINVDWDPLIDRLKQCAYIRDGKDQKLKAVVYIVPDDEEDACDSRDRTRQKLGDARYVELIEEEEGKARGFFAELGMDVEVIYTEVGALEHEPCGHCRGMLRMRSAPILWSQL